MNPRLGAHWKPVVALLVITPFLTELLSGSLPAQKFFQPPVFLFLATIGYGFPVLLLRELAVRRQLGVAGLFLLGLVYGIFNEGILAKTFYLAKNVPINTFDGYGYVFGIAVPWAIMINIWHALHSLLYPIVAIYYFFPNERETPWLNRRGMIWLSVPTLAVGALIFFSHGMDRAAGHWEHFLLMVILGAILVWLATRLPSAPILGDNERLRWRPMFWGAGSFVALLFLPVLMAGAKIPAPVLCGYCGLLIVFAMRKLVRRPALPTTTVLSFALGDDILMAVLGVAIGIGHGNPERIIVNAVFILVFGWLIARLRSGAG